MGFNSDSDSDYGSESPPKPFGKRFHIEVNGRFVIKPNTAEGEDEPKVMLGEIQNAATFALAGKYLWCDDWFMGRPFLEPAVPMAFPICWRKWPERTQEVKILESNGSTVIESNGRRFAFDPSEKALISGEAWMLDRFKDSMATVHWL